MGLLAGDSTLFQGASDFQIHGGNFIAAKAGRDVNITLLSSTADHSGAEWVLMLIPKNHLRKIQIDTHRKRVPNSGIWFIERADLQAWLHGQTDANIYWVTGDAGTGKTIIASTIIAEIEKIEKPSSDTEAGIALAYVYCRYTESTSVEDLLVALVRQQLERNPSLAPLIAPLFNKHRRENSSPSKGELLDLLKAISTKFRITFYVLDALDEFPLDLRFEILEALVSVNTRLFITSRPLRHLERHIARVSPVTSFVPLKAHKDDIKLLVDAETARHPDLGDLVSTHQIQDEIINTVYENCQGVFLHAAMQMQVLRHCAHLDRLRKALKEFPADIRHFFAANIRRALNQPDESQVQIVKQGLLWILHAKTALSIEELQHAISFDPITRVFNPARIIPVDRLVSLFCGLVTVDEESRLVRLVHYTAMDPIKAELASDLLYLDPHAVLATTCITHLVDNTFQNYEPPDGSRFPGSSIDTLNRHYTSVPLLQYAHKWWASHVHGTSSPDIQLLCTSFVLRCKAYPLERYLESSPIIDALTAIHVAAFYNFPDLVSYIVNPVDPGALDCGGDEYNRGYQQACAVTPIQALTPLYLAVNGGHVEVTRLLLEVPGILVNQTSKNGMSPLMVASHRGYTGIVRLLLESPGILVNATNPADASPLIIASSCGHEDIVRLLLGAAGIRATYINKDSVSAIAAASYKGHTGVVRLLLGVQDGAIDQASKCNATALVAASLGGHEDIVRLLLLSEPDITAAEDANNIALALRTLSKNGHEGILRLLLGLPEVAALVNQKSEDGSWTLMNASLKGHEGIIGLLLEVPGILVNQTDERGLTALMVAAMEGHEGAVRLLLGAQGIFVNQVDNEGWSAFMRAARYGHASIVALFPGAAGVDVNTTSSHGSSALTLASQYGHTEVVALLLSRPEINVSQVDRDGDSSLSIARQLGHEAIIELLEEVIAHRDNFGAQLECEPAAPTLPESGPQDNANPSSPSGVVPRINVADAQAKYIKDVSVDVTSDPQAAPSIGVLEQVKGIDDNPPTSSLSPDDNTTPIPQLENPPRPESRRSTLTPRPGRRMARLGRTLSPTSLLKRLLRCFFPPPPDVD